MWQRRQSKRMRATIRITLWHLQEFGRSGRTRAWQERLHSSDCTVHCHRIRGLLPVLAGSGSGSTHRKRHSVVRWSDLCFSAGTPRPPHSVSRY